MIRIAISQAAFDAIAATLPLGSVSFENAITENGDRLIWLERRWLDRLRALRGRGESYSDVICGWRRKKAGREAEIAVCGLPRGLAGLLGWGDQARMRRQRGVAWRRIHWFRRSSQ